MLDAGVLRRAETGIVPGGGRMPRAAWVYDPELDRIVAA
jgi:hypothetical protein